MLKNFDTVLNDLQEMPILNADKQGATLTAKDATLAALLIANQNKPVSGEEKFKRWQLAQRVSAGGEVEVTPEEITLIKELAGDVYSAIVIGPLYIFLNG
jgi:hypothetical protein